MNNSLFKATMLAAATLALVALPCPAQNLGKIKNSAKTVAAGVTISKNGGKTTVTYNHQVVWTGVPENLLTSKTATAPNGTQCVAVYDGTKLVWENVKGASQFAK